MKITYLGHSAFEICTNNQKILIDPFLIMSPNYNPSGVTDIFVTHAHSDHLGSAIEISKKNGGKITGIFELANYCLSRGAHANGIGLGSWNTYPWGKAIAVPAFHSSSFDNGMYGGIPCGFVFKIEGKTLYHAGDTALSSEMKTIGELYTPDLVMLPVGGHYTMDIEHSLIAADWLKASEVIPMHYNTFDAIKVNIANFETEIKEMGKKPVVLKINETYNI